MKHFTKLISKKSLYFSLAILSITLLNSCAKNNSANDDIAYLRIVNASPALATYNIYLNSTITNSAAIPFAGAVSYKTLTSGSYNLKFTSASTIETLFSTTATLSINNYHSFYLIGKPGALSSLLIGDDMSVPATDKAYIRFVHLSPDAPALDLVKTGSTSLFTNKAYKTASSFIAVDPGTLSLDVKETTSGIVKASVTSPTLVAGYHYDIICGGLVTPANDTERALNIQVLKIQ